MNKRGQNLKYFGLLLLLVFLGYAYFGSKRQAPKKNEDSEIYLRAPSINPLPARKSPQILNPTTKTKSSESQTEKVAEPEKRFIGICEYLEEESKRTKEKRTKEKREGAESYEDAIERLHLYGPGRFLYTLPISSKYYDITLKRKVTEAERNLYDVQGTIELQNNLGRAKEAILRSYYTLLMARAIGLSPKLLHDPERAAICLKLDNIDVPLSRQELNNFIYSFLQKENLQASEIKFNPTFEPKVEIQIGEDGPYYSVGPDGDL